MTSINICLIYTLFAMSRHFFTEPNNYKFVTKPFKIWYIIGTAAYLVFGLVYFITDPTDHMQNSYKMLQTVFIISFSLCGFAMIMFARNLFMKPWYVSGILMFIASVGDALVGLLMLGSSITDDTYTWCVFEQLCPLFTNQFISDHTMVLAMVIIAQLPFYGILLYYSCIVISSCVVCIMRLFCSGSTIDSNNETNLRIHASPINSPTSTNSPTVSSPISPLYFPCDSQPSDRQKSPHYTILAISQ